MRGWHRLLCELLALTPSVVSHRFTVADAGGVDVELVPGGADIPVRWTARREYIGMVRRHKVGEFRRQVDAIARGLATQVRVAFLRHTLVA